MYGSLDEMLTLEILCIGKMSSRWFADGLDEYVKRLGAYDRVVVTELPEFRITRDTAAARAEAVEKEGEQLARKLAASGRSLKVALCVEGKLYSSEALAELLEKAKQDYPKVTFVIGGSAGLSSTVKDMCDVKLSMSPMTFTHQMARMILAEQLYRAESINSGGKYHK